MPFKDKYGGEHRTQANANARNRLGSNVFASLYPSSAQHATGVVTWRDGKKHIDGVPVGPALGGRRTRHRKRGKRSTRRR